MGVKRVYGCRLFRQQFTKRSLSAVQEYIIKIKTNTNDWEIACGQYRE